MDKCHVCQNNVAEWAWQPFGPSEDADCFTALGSHYRGFPVIKICDDCKQRYQSGEPLVFVYRGLWYSGEAIPDDEKDTLIQAAELRRLSE